MYDMKKPRFFRRFTLDVSGTRPLRRKSEVLINAQTHDRVTEPWYPLLRGPAGCQ